MFNFLGKMGIQVSIWQVGRQVDRQVLDLNVNKFSIIKISASVIYIEGNFKKLSNNLLI